MVRGTRRICRSFSPVKQAQFLHMQIGNYYFVFLAFFYFNMHFVQITNNKILLFINVQICDNPISVNKYYCYYILRQMATLLACCSIIDSSKLQRGHRQWATWLHHQATVSLGHFSRSTADQRAAGPVWRHPQHTPNISFLSVQLDTRSGRLTSQNWR